MNIVAIFTAIAFQFMVQSVHELKPSGSFDRKWFEECPDLVLFPYFVVWKNEEHHYYDTITRSPLWRVTLNQKEIAGTSHVIRHPDGGYSKLEGHLCENSPSSLLAYAIRINPTDLPYEILSYVPAHQSFVFSFADKHHDEIMNYGCQLRRDLVILAEREKDMEWEGMYPWSYKSIKAPVYPSKELKSVISVEGSHYMLSSFYNHQSTPLDVIVMQYPSKGSGTFLVQNDIWYLLNGAEPVYGITFYTPSGAYNGQSWNKLQPLPEFVKRFMAANTIHEAVVILNAPVPKGQPGKVFTTETLGKPRGAPNGLEVSSASPSTAPCNNLKNYTSTNVHRQPSQGTALGRRACANTKKYSLVQHRTKPKQKLD